MTQEENSDNHQAQDASDREDEFQRLQKRRSELAGEIVQSEKHSSDLVGNIAEITDQIMADYKKDMDALQAFGKRIETRAIASLDKMAERSRATINSVFSYLLIYFVVVVVSLVAIGAFGGYLYVIYIPDSALVFFGSWAILSVIILVFLWFLRQSLSAKDLNSEVKVETINLMQEASSRPQPIHDLSPIKRFTKAAMNGIKGLTASALELIPNVDKIIEHQNKRLIRQKFIENFLFALHRYEIEATTETKGVIFTKSWVLDDEHRWLRDVSNEMSSIFKDVDSKFFQLMYYEFFDEKYASKLWSEIRYNKEIRTKISKFLIERNLITTPNEAGSIHIVATLLEQLPRYALDEIKSRASDFFSDLATFKNSCLSHLDFYGLRIVEKERLLSEYVPPSPDTSRWRDEVISYIAKQIVSKRTINVKLLIQSAEGDQESTKTWTNIVESGELEELTAILARKRIRPKYDVFDRNTFLSHLKLAMTQNVDEFSLTEIETSLEALEAEIIHTKYRIQHTIAEYKLGLTEVDFINSFVPSKVSTIEEELLNTLSQKLGIDFEIISLLYYSANGLDRAQEAYEKLVCIPKIEELAKLLVQKSLITESKFTVNTVHLLRTQSSFILSRFISIYDRYELLSESLDAFCPFLKANGTLNREPLVMEEVLKICPTSDNDSLENHLVKIALELISNVIGEIVLDKEQHSDLALASAALFMRTHGYTGYPLLCQRASRRDFATKVLFQYITLVAEESLSGPHETLKNAITRAIKGTFDTGNYEYFKAELADGKLAPSAVFLFSQYRQEIKMEFKNLQEKGFETQILRNYLDSIRGLLYQSIDEKVVREFLLNQVLSAYLLTVPGGVPGIGFIEDGAEYIRQAEKELASREEDPSYSDLVKLSAGAGKATRIGLVPIELDFEDFSIKFNEIWTLAVKLYNKAEDNKILDPLPCYIIRIFPSEDGLKEIMPSVDIKTKPLEVVRELIRDSVNSEDSISLLSLIQKAPSGKLALIKVIQEIFDSPRSALQMMISDHIDILSKSLKKKFEKKEIDASLFKDYQVTKISQLGEKLAERVSEAGESATRNEFKGRMIKAIGDKTGISSDETEILVGTVFKHLYSIGIASII